MAFVTTNYTSDTPGTPKAVDVKNIGHPGMVIQAIGTNTGLVAIGGPNVNAATQVGITLGVGTDANSDKVGDAIAFDEAFDFYYDVADSGDGITVLLV